MPCSGCVLSGAREVQQGAPVVGGNVCLVDVQHADTFGQMYMGLLRMALVARYPREMLETVLKGIRRVFEG